MKHTISLLVLSISFFMNAQSLDPSFGTNGGIVVNQTSTTIPDDYVKNAVLQSDDKLLVISNNSSTSIGSLSRITPEGFLDATFNNYGFKNFGTLRALALQADGKILVTSGNVIYRVNADGSTDTSFNISGRQTISINNYSMTINTIVVKNNGKILLAGSVSNGNDNDLALASLNTDGSFDTFFDFDGKLTLDIAQQNNDATGLVSQADGKIVVCGQAFNGSSQQLMLARFTAVGSLDTSFSTVGYTISTQATVLYPQAIALQSDGKAVVSGAISGDKLFVQRYTTSGSLDSTFATAGYLATTFYNSYYPFNITVSNKGCSRLILLPNGKILVSANVVTNGFGLVQLNANGTLDTSFGSNGSVSLSIGFDKSRFLALNSAGKIVTGGFTIGEGIEKLIYSATGVLESEVNVHILQSDEKINALLEQSTQKTIALLEDNRLVRYNSNGTIDSTFGLNGFVENSFPNFYFGGLFVLDGDKIILVGNDSTLFYTSLFRLTADGQVDTSFGNNGLLLLDNPTINQSAIDRIRVLNGKIYITYDYYTPESIANNTYNSYYGIMRLNLDGTPDTSFGNGGIFYKNFNFFTTTDYEYPNDVKIDESNNIVVTGVLRSRGSIYSSAVATIKLNPNGVLDTTFGSNGVVISNPTGSTKNWGADLYIVNGNKYLINCLVTENDGQRHSSFIQHNTDGSVDSSYGTNGVLNLAYSYYNNYVAQQPDGKILIANNLNAQFGLTRYTATGTLDTSFGTNGQLSTSIYFNSGIRSLLFLQNGKLLVGGSAFNGSSNVLAQARYTNLNLSNPNFGQAKHAVSVYPNPVTSNFIIRSASEVASSVALVNLLGQEVYRSTLQGAETQITKTWPGSGLYLVNIYDQNNQLLETHKVVFE
ncbi:MAG: hypothetical protein RL699_1412 [Bacteroidota bacterium]|jgi:uncharacterized delta-60 repeat protein